MQNMLPLQKCESGVNIRDLTDVEVLAIVIGTGTSGIDVMDLSASLIKRFNGLHGISLAGIRELSTVKGIGLKKSIRIKCCVEIGRRVVGYKLETTIMKNPLVVWKYMIPFMACLEQEEFHVLILNTKNQLLKRSIVSVGSISQTVVHPREVFRSAIREGGSSVIVVHNHPSGSLEPSKEDYSVTDRLIETGDIIGIPIADHIIISNRGYCSLKERGYIR